MTSREVRETFLRFFAAQGHTSWPALPWCPTGTPACFSPTPAWCSSRRSSWGKRQRPYTRATSSQKCVRAGGKHNDLENVGYTARHHTFFEMLGNFSFGDYFKEGAIAMAWELLTEHYHLPPERLWATVYHEDDEARPPLGEDRRAAAERIVRLGEKDNFWAMGDTGPCGPCSEIIYRPGRRDGLRPGLRHRQMRLRPISGDLEPGVHAVQPGPGRHPGSAAQTQHRHRHGSGAPGGRHPGGDKATTTRTSSGP